MMYRTAALICRFVAALSSSGRYGGGQACMECGIGLHHAVLMPSVLCTRMLIVCAKVTFLCFQLLILERACGDAFSCAAVLRAAQSPEAALLVRDQFAYMHSMMTSAALRTAQMNFDRPFLLQCSHQKCSLGLVTH
jgi:hypothetical protein